MSVALTIEDLDETVAEELRLSAARHGWSLEAEARDILVQEIRSRRQTAEASLPQAPLTGHPFVQVAGSWAGRGTTDEMMKDLRGEE